MRTLAIDSATEACSVALFDGETLIAGDWRLLGRGHAEALVPMIAALPGKGRAERIVASLGPGSFTGVRVGLAAARALALAWDARLAGFATLELAAAMARAQHGAQPVDVVMTGGHGEWFVQSFDENATASAPVASLAPAEAARACHADLIVGSQAAALVEARGRGRAIALLPDARAALLLAPGSLSHELTPIYGRPPDARALAG